MKPQLAISLILFSAMAISPDLLWRLKSLLAQLTQILTAQQAQLKPLAPISSSPKPMSRVTLDIGFVPEILSITPSHGPLGTTITIRGRGFTKTGNIIYASYGTFPDRPSPDNETITLQVIPPGLPPNLGSLKTAGFPELRYRFYLRNANGETAAPGEFVLDL